MTKKEETPADPLAGLAVGRMVHYYPREPEARNVGSVGEPAVGPWAAIVTMVGHHSWPDTPGLVNLNVQMPMVAPVGEDPAMRFQQVPFSEEPAPGCWSWPTRT